MKTLEAKRTMKQAEAKSQAFNPLLPMLFLHLILLGKGGANLPLADLKAYWNTVEV